MIKIIVLTIASFSLHAQTINHDYICRAFGTPVDEHLMASGFNVGYAVTADSEADAAVRAGIKLYADAQTKPEIREFYQSGQYGIECEEREFRIETPQWLVGHWRATKLECQRNSSHAGTEIRDLPKSVSALEFQQSQAKVYANLIDSTGRIGPVQLQSDPSELVIGNILFDMRVNDTIDTMRITARNTGLLGCKTEQYARVTLELRK